MVRLTGDAGRERLFPGAVMNGFEVSKAAVEGFVFAGNRREERLGGEDDIAALFKAFTRLGVRGVLASDLARCLVAGVFGWLNICLFVFCMFSFPFPLLSVGKMGGKNGDS